MKFLCSFVIYKLETLLTKTLCFLPCFLRGRKIVPVILSSCHMCLFLYKILISAHLDCFVSNVHDDCMYCIKILLYLGSHLITFCSREMTGVSKSGIRGKRVKSLCHAYILLNDIYILIKVLTTCI